MMPEGPITDSVIIRDRRWQVPPTGFSGLNRHRQANNSIPSGGRNQIRTPGRQWKG